MKHEASTKLLWSYLGAPDFGEGSDTAVYHIGTAIPFDLGAEFVVLAMDAYVTHAARHLREVKRDEIESLTKLRDLHSGRHQEVVKALDELDDLVVFRRAITYQQFCDLQNLKRDDLRVKQDPPTLHDFLKQRNFSERQKQPPPKHPNRADYLNEEDRLRNRDWDNAVDQHRDKVLAHQQREEQGKRENRERKNQLKNEYTALCKNWNQWQYSSHFLSLPGAKFLLAAERFGYFTIDDFFERFKPEPEDYAALIHEFREEIPFVQKFLLSPQDIPLRESDRRKHTYITGMTGSGKTELLKWLATISCASETPQTAFVIDPTGNFVRQLAEKEDFIEMSSVESQATDVFAAPEVIYFDPLLGDKQGLFPGINPFDIEVSSDTEIDGYAQLLTDAFQEILGEFTRNMQTLLNSCLIVLLSRKNSTLEDLQDFMVDGENNGLVAEARKVANPAVQKFFETQFGESHFVPTRNAISAKLQALLTSDIFRKVVTQKTTLPLQRAMEKGGVLFLCSFSKGLLGDDVSSALGRLLIAMIKAHAFRRASIPESKRIPTHLIIDEFQNYVGPSLETILTEARQYRLYLTLAAQVVGQNMGSQLEDIAISCTNLKFVGTNGDKTYRKLSSEIKVPVEKLGDLRVGDFYVNATQAADIPPVRLHVKEDMLDDKGQAGKADIKAFYAQQLERYYLPYPKEGIRDSDGAVGSEDDGSAGDAPEPKIKL